MIIHDGARPSQHLPHQPNHKSHLDHLDHLDWSHLEAILSSFEQFLVGFRGFGGPNGYREGAIPSQTYAIPAESHKVTTELTKVA